jgi:hypothetical protein
VEALSRNLLADKSDLIIYSDGPRALHDAASVLKVREYIKSITGFKSVKIVESAMNKGLAKSIIDGVTEVLKESETIIVLEDDILTSPYFLDFMNRALGLYEHEEKVISIHGYVYPVKDSLPDTFFLRGADCWGWATWRRGWSLFEQDGVKLLAELKKRKLVRHFDFNNSYSYSKMLSDQIKGRNDSWAIRWHASAFLANRFTLYPGVSFVSNIGFDSSGTHSGLSKDFDVALRTEGFNLRKIPITEHAEAFKAFSNYLKTVEDSMLERVKKRIKRFF